MPDGKTLQVTVITPARTALKEEAVSLVFTASDGSWGILPGHAPLIARLGCGPLRVTRPDLDQVFVAVRGGFVQVKAGAITFLTPESVRPEELDPAALDEEGQRLHEAEVPEERREEHEQALAWWRARRKLADLALGLDR